MKLHHKVFLGLAFAGIVIFAVFATGCNKDNDVSSPTSIEVDSAPVASAPAPAPTPAASPTPNSSPAPPMSYIRNKNKQDGSGEFCGLPVGGSSVYLSYNPVGATSPTWAKLEVKDPNVHDDICVPIPPAAQVLQAQYGCGFNRKVQIDGNQSGYNAGRFVGSITTDVAIKTADCGCEDYEKPGVNVTLGTPVTSQTLTTFTVQSIPVTKDPAAVAGSFAPNPPQTVDRPEHGQPAGTINFVYNWTYEYHPTKDLTCSLSGNVPKNVSVPPRNDTCDNYQAPTITGDISSDVQATQVVFDKGTVAPNGGSFNPVLPQTIARPPYGQPSGSFSTTYYLPYGPAQLECEVSKTFTKKVPPQDCPKVTRWTLKNKRNDGPWTIVVATNKNDPANSLIVPQGEFVLGAHQSTTFSGYSNSTLHAFFKLPQFKTVNTYWYDGENNDIKNDCESEGGTYYSNKDGRHDVCATKHDHGNKWEYDHNDYAYKYKTTNEQVPDGFKYDWADSESSGSCGSGGPTAQWAGDASLKAECVCPLD